MNLFNNLIIKNTLSNFYFVMPIDKQVIPYYQPPIHYRYLSASNIIKNFDFNSWQNQGYFQINFQSKINYYISLLKLKLKL